MCFYLLNQMVLSGSNYLFVFLVCWPGLAPAGDLLSCSCKKGGKEHAPKSATPSLRYGANLWRGACGVCRRTHCALRASFKQLRQVSARSACVLRHTHAPPALRFSARAEGNPGRGHPHGPLLRCTTLGPVSRAQAPRATQARPSAAMARMDVRLFGCLDVRLSHPCWLRLRRGGVGVAWASQRPCFVL